MLHPLPPGTVSIAAGIARPNGAGCARRSSPDNPIAGCAERWVEPTPQPSSTTGNRIAATQPSSGIRATSASLCATHHSATKQRAERGRVTLPIAANGWPSPGDGIVPSPDLGGGRFRDFFPIVRAVSGCFFTHKAVPRFLRNSAHNWSDRCQKRPFRSPRRTFAPARRFGSPRCARRMSLRITTFGCCSSRGRPGIGPSRRARSWQRPG